MALSAPTSAPPTNVPTQDPAARKEFSLPINKIKRRQRFSGGTNHWPRANCPANSDIGTRNHHDCRPKCNTHPNDVHHDSGLQSRFEARIQSAARSARFLTEGLRPLRYANLSARCRQGQGDNCRFRENSENFNIEYKNNICWRMELTCGRADYRRTRVSGSKALHSLTTKGRLNNEHTSQGGAAPGWAAKLSMAKSRQGT